MKVPFMHPGKVSSVGSVNNWTIPWIFHQQAPFCSTNRKTSFTSMTMFGKKCMRSSNPIQIPYFQLSQSSTLFTPSPVQDASKLFFIFHVYILQIDIVWCIWCIFHFHILQIDIVWWESSLIPQPQWQATLNLTPIRRKYGEFQLKYWSSHHRF